MNNLFAYTYAIGGNFSYHNYLVCPPCESPTPFWQYGYCTRYCADY